MTVRNMVVCAVVFIVALGIAVPNALAGCGCQKASPGIKKASPAISTSDTGNPLRKLGRGVCNVVTFPFEIPYRIGQTNRTDGPFAAMTYGVVKGVVMTGLRAVVGVYEVISFPFPLPEGYKPILADPEFFFEGQEW